MDAWWLGPKFSISQIHFPKPDRKPCKILALLQKKCLINAKSLVRDKIIPKVPRHTSQLHRSLYPIGQNIWDIQKIYHWESVVRAKESCTFAFVGQIGPLGWFYGLLTKPKLYNIKQFHFVFADFPRCLAVVKIMSRLPLLLVSSWLSLVSYTVRALRRLILPVESLVHWYIVSLSMVPISGTALLSLVGPKPIFSLSAFCNFLVEKNEGMIWESRLSIAFQSAFCCLSGNFFLFAYFCLKGKERVWTHPLS